MGIENFSVNQPESLGTEPTKGLEKPKEDTLGTEPTTGSESLGTMETTGVEENKNKEEMSEMQKIVLEQVKKPELKGDLESILVLLKKILSPENSSHVNNRNFLEALSDVLREAIKTETNIDIISVGADMIKELDVKIFQLTPEK